MFQLIKYLGFRDLPRYHRVMRRWVVLGIFAWIAGLSQLLWLNFAPVLSFVEKYYAVSETAASLLLLVFPLTYVLFSIHAGKLIDSRGYKYSIGLGAVLMAVFSCLRIYTGSFWILLLAQTGISIGQPYIVNAITKLVLDWFPPEHTVLATGLGTVGMFLGMAIGMAVTPPLFDAFGFPLTMLIFAIVSCVSCALFFVLCQSKTPPELLKESSAISKEFWSQMKNRNLVLLFFISLIGLGFFNGLTSWIEAILAPHGISSVQAGVIGGVLIVGGIFGSIVIPALSDRFHTKKGFLILSVLMAALTLVPLCRSADYKTLLIFGFLQGFFFLPAYALLLDMTALEAGPKWVGSATGVLMLTGNAGGVIAILAMGWMKGDQTGFSQALYFLMSLLLVAMVAAFFTREPRVSA